MNYTDDHICDFFQHITSAAQLHLCRYCNKYILFELAYSENKWYVSEDVESCMSANEKIIKDIIE